MPRRPLPLRSPRQELDRAIARVHPTVPAVWRLSNRYGSWGTTDLAAHTVYISPRVPARRMYDVAVHEYNHLPSVADYNDDASAAIAAMNGFFGGTGLQGAELAADCGARLRGAQWTGYPACSDPRWRSGAARLLRGQRLR